MENGINDLNLGVCRTDAERALDTLQRESPPEGSDAASRGTDRVQHLYHLLNPGLPEWAVTKHRSGHLIFGELGSKTPDAYMEPFGDGSAGVFINSGYIRLLHAVSRDVIASQNQLPDGTPLNPSISFADAVLRTASVLQQYLNNRVWEGFTVSIDPMVLPPDQADRANQLTDAAMLFTFSHELGHASQKFNSIDMDARPDARTRSKELDADIFAFGMVIANAHRLDLVWTYCGAFFMLSLLACLERAGYKFKDMFSLKERVDWLKESIRTDLSKPYLSISQKLHIFAWESYIEQYFNRVEAAFSLFKNQGVHGEPRNDPPIPAKPVAEWSETKAIRRLKELQEEFPPWEWTDQGKPLDRTRWFLELLGSNLPFSARERLRTGQLSIGEVGSLDALYSLEAFDDGSRMIRINSGYLAIVMAVSRFLHTRVGLVGELGEETGTIWPERSTVFCILRLFEMFEEGQLQRVELEMAVPGFWQPSGTVEDFLGQGLTLTNAQYKLANELFVGVGAYVLLSLICRSLQLSAGSIAGERSAEAMALFLFTLLTPFLGFRKTYPAVLLAVRIGRCIELARGAALPAKFLSVVRELPSDATRVPLRSSPADEVLLVLRN